MNFEQEIFKRYQQKKIYLGMIVRTDYFNRELLKTAIGESTTEKLGRILTDIISHAANIEHTIAPLKPILTPVGLSHYRTQYRQFKYRNRNKLKSITIKEETYNKLKSAAEHFEGIDDMLFDYLLEPRDHHHTDVIRDAVQGMPSALSVPEQFERVMGNIPSNAKDIIDKMITFTFLKAYEEGLVTHKPRNEKIKSKLLIDKMKWLD